MVQPVLQFSTAGACKTRLAMFAGLLNETVTGPEMSTRSFAPGTFPNIQFAAVSHFPSCADPVQVIVIPAACIVGTFKLTIVKTKTVRRTRLWFEESLVFNRYLPLLPIELWRVVEECVQKKNANSGQFEPSNCGSSSGVNSEALTGIHQNQTLVNKSFDCSAQYYEPHMIN